jgi:DNA-binding beta-propeller fold protein YncE
LEPLSVSVDHVRGVAFVADHTRNIISTFDSTGFFLGSFGSTGNDTAQFNGAYALAVDASDSTLFVTDEGNNRVEVFSIPRLASLLPHITYSSSNDLLRIDVLQNGAGTIRVYDLRGRLLRSFEFEDALTADVPGLRTGYYVIELQTGEKRVVEKFFFNRD